MSRENRRKEALICGTLEGRYTIKQVAGLLGLSQRRVLELREQYKKQGGGAFIHGNTGKRPANTIPENLKTYIVALRGSTSCRKLSVSRFRNLLEDRENIKVSYTALSNILKTAGLVSVRRSKFFKLKGAFGERLGLVVNLYHWFGDGMVYALHGIIDEATRCITGLYFCIDECVKGYTEVIRDTIVQYGVPLEIYMEKAERLNENDACAWQLGLIIRKRLGIDILNDSNIHLAKSRARWLRLILESRLPRWLEAMGIRDIEKANSELHHFVALFNDKFSNEPRTSESLFVPLGKHNLDLLMTVRHEKTVDAYKCFYHSDFSFTIDTEKPIEGKRIEFLFNEEIGFLAYCNNEYYKVIYAGSKNKDRIYRSSDVLNLLIHESYYASLNDSEVFKSECTSLYEIIES